MIPERFELIAIEQIVESAVNPRRTFNEEKLAELAETIREKGLIEPLVTRPVNSHFELVAGARRLRAARMAGLSEVPCMVRDYSDADVLEIQIIENLQREGVNLFEEAEGYRALRERLGYDVATIAAKIGKSKRYVYQRLEVGGVVEPVRQAVSDRTITANHAILIARLPQAEQQQRALEMAVQRDSSVRGLDQWIKRSLLLKLTAAPFDVGDAELWPGAGSCTDCPKRTGNARELFAEISSPDVCTDRSCYELKVDAHIKREVGRDRDLLRIMTDWHWPGKPKYVYERDRYVEVGKARCATVVRGIVVHGDRRGAVLEVCISPTCKKHHGARAGGYRRSPTEVEKDRQAKLKLEMTRAVRGRIVDALVAKAPRTVSHGLLEDWAESWWDGFSSDQQRIVRKRHAWDADTNPVGDLSEPQLIQLLVEFSLAPELMVFQWGGDKGVSKELQARADAAGVEWKALEAEVKREFAERAAAKGRKGKPLAEALKDPPAKKKRRKGAAAKPDEHGAFAIEDCEVITCAEKGFTADVCLVRAADGWYAGFHATLASTAVTELPRVSQPAFESRAVALSTASALLSTWAEALRGSKKEQARKLKEWCEGLVEDVQKGVAG